MKRTKGIIVILVGVGLLFISIFFSSGYDSKRGLIGNIPRMKNVLVRGEYDPILRRSYGGVAIPLKYPLSLSVVLILFGTGIVLISKNNETNT